MHKGELIDQTPHSVAACALRLHCLAMSIYMKEKKRKTFDSDRVKVEI